MSWLFSQALVAEYSEATCSDGARSALSSGSPTPRAFLPPDRMTAFSRPSRFGMTFGPLTDTPGTGSLQKPRQQLRTKVFRQRFARHPKSGTFQKLHHSVAGQAQPERMVPTQQRRRFATRAVSRQVFLHQHPRKEPTHSSVLRSLPSCQHRLFKKLLTRRSTRTQAINPPAPVS